MMYKENWEETQRYFTAWWNGEKTGRPIMRVVAKRDKPLKEFEQEINPGTPQEMHIGIDYNISKMRNFCRHHKFMAEAFPCIELNIGPGSMALYLGSEPVFAWDTIWYKECIEDWRSFKVNYDENNHWFKLHKDIIKQAQDFANGDFLVSIPDIIENADILSALRGPQAFCYDLIDEPDLIKEFINQIDDIYFKYYNAFYNLVKARDGSCSYTSFNIWGPGKTGKVQCDFSAMMSPGQFRELIVPSLEKQCRQLDYSLYHLDGRDAIRHLDALMGIKELNALQWTAGAGNPDGGSKQWYPIYEKVRMAGKSLWISIYDGEYENWVKSADDLVKSFGSEGLYLLFLDMTEEQAIRIIDRAEEKWS